MLADVRAPYQLEKLPLSEERVQIHPSQSASRIITLPPLAARAPHFKPAPPS